ncbi:hypothetical protein JXB02_01450 [Candidatus Woesearchaeota archaeon]|nr:hypothetical protein [Candidatus Woesearchaeota archaeon]
MKTSKPTTRMLRQGMLERYSCDELCYIGAKQGLDEPAMEELAFKGCPPCFGQDE